MNTPEKISRRSFSKTSAFTAVSLLVLSQGIALANPEGASGSDGTGCPAKTTKSFNNQKEITLRTDIYTQYKKKTAPYSTIYVVQTGTVTHDSASKPAPGDYSATFSVNRGDKTCNYARDNSAPVTTTVSDTGWVKTGNENYSPAYTALPGDAAQWDWQSAANASFKREIVWDSVQAYILI